MLLLHGFPQFWWAWRDQLPALAAAGYRAVAMDLRGYGGSDKTPNGYDPVTLAQDVSGVVKALGGRDAVLVGHGWGGYVAWATAVLHQREVSALCVVAAPHPRAMLGALRPGRAATPLRHVLAMQVPMRPERRLADPASGFLRDHLRAWSAPARRSPTSEAVATYQRAMGLWPSSHCALEYHRWLLRSRLRSRRAAPSPGAAAPAVGQPVLLGAGRRGPGGTGRGRRGARARTCRSAHRAHELPGVGHFPPEEDAAAFTRLLLAWLAGVR